VLFRLLNLSNTSKHSRIDYHYPKWWRWIIITVVDYYSLLLTATDYYYWSLSCWLLLPFVLFIAVIHYYWLLVSLLSSLMYCIITSIITGIITSIIFFRRVRVFSHFPSGGSRPFFQRKTPRSWWLRWLCRTAWAQRGRWLSRVETVAFIVCNFLCNSLFAIWGVDPSGLDPIPFKSQQKPKNSQKFMSDCEYCS
jgi:hypothetical protein